MLANNSVTINTAGGLTGGGTVALGGTLTLTQGTSAVTSVFGRSGAVTAATNDYNFNQLAGSLASTQDYNVGTAGTYTKVTTDAKGRVSSGTSAASSDLSDGTALVKNNAANTFTSAGTLDLNAASATAGLRAPVAAGAAPTVSGQLAYDSTANVWVGGTNGSTEKLSGWEFLGSASCSSSCGTTSTITIAARDMLMIVVRIAGYAGGGDIASLRFNADSTTTNYHTRHINFSNASTPALSSNNFTSSGHITLGPTAINAGRTVEVLCSNRSSNRKVCTIRQQEEATSQGTFAQMEIGYGEWFNTSAQITQIQLRTDGGANMVNGAGFMVFGRNF
jgi:hypothetical protein